MVSFASINQVRGNKPGARVLAKVREEGKDESHPALITHQFGRGRVGAMLIGDLWRWGLKEAEQRKDMDRAWRQTIRWLVADARRRWKFPLLREEEDGRSLERAYGTKLRTPQLKSPFGYVQSVQRRKYPWLWLQSTSPEAIQPNSFRGQWRLPRRSRSS